jgi:DNA-directed RNA polymerase specialized sigma subunit
LLLFVLAVFLRIAGKGGIVAELDQATQKMIEEALSCIGRFFSTLAISREDKEDCLAQARLEMLVAATKRMEGRCFTYLRETGKKAGLRFLRDNGRAISMPAYQQERLSEIKKVTNRQGAISAEEVAAELQRHHNPKMRLTAEQVEGALVAQEVCALLSLDSPIVDDLTLNDVVSTPLYVPAPSEDRICERIDLHNRLDKVISVLSPAETQVFQLSWMGYDTTEIAVIRKTGVTGAGNQKRYAIRKLKAAWFERKEQMRFSFA